MTGLVFVMDAKGVPLMPMSAAYARKLLKEGKAHREPHHAFMVIRLTRAIDQPQLRPIELLIDIRLHVASMILSITDRENVRPHMQVLVDLRSDLSPRLRRRAGHRRRRHLRGRYRPLRRHGVPFKLRRPSLHRSAWGTALRQRKAARTGHRPGMYPPIIRWRAQAIERVIAALRRYLPISRVVVPKHAAFALSGAALSPAERRLALIDAYGYETTTGQRIARCGYCGTIDNPIEVDHLLPRSRGGTDAWGNLALTCGSCNRRKADRTPEEAGMALRFMPPRSLQNGQRERPYSAQTCRLLVRRLATLGIPTGMSSAEQEASEAPEEVSASSLTSFVAKPISRPPHQVYTARNYPLTTPLRPGLTRVARYIKRRVMVNRGLVVADGPKRPQVQVIGANDERLEGRWVRLGMLCSASRAGTTITGIVSAIHTAARLTLLTLTAASADEIRWQRIVVSPRQALRVLSSDYVIFISRPRGRR